MTPRQGAGFLPAPAPVPVAITIADWVQAHTFSLAIGLTVLLFIGEWLLKNRQSLWYGYWTFDPATREMRRILAHDHRGPLVDIKLQNERRAIASDLRGKRHNEIFVGLAVEVISLGFLYHVFHTQGPVFWPTTSQLYPLGAIFTVALTIMAGLLVVYYCFVLLGFIGKETLYVSNFQHMRGAKVIDPDALARETPDGVHKQKVYGDARPATAQEAADAYAPSSASKPDIDFER